MRHQFVEESRSHSAIILIVGPGDLVPLVIERSKPKPHYWKFPGGSGEGNETPVETAQAESGEEVGLYLPLEAFCEVSCEDRGTHTKHNFFAQTKSFDGLKSFGDEGEEVRLFHLTEILAGTINLLPLQKPFVETIKELIEQ